jgi:hypothetical protein
MGILISIFVASVFAGMVAVGIKRLSPKRGDWLPVITATFVPPFLYLVCSIFSSLVALGGSANSDGAPKLDSIDPFIASVEAYIFFAVIWMIVAVPASFVALRLFRTK